MIRIIENRNKATAVEGGEHRGSKIIRGANKDAGPHPNYKRHFGYFYKLLSSCNIMEMLTNALVGIKTLFRQKDFCLQHYHNASEKR